MCGFIVDLIVNEIGYVWLKDFGFSGGKGVFMKVVNGIVIYFNLFCYFDSLDGF